MIREKLLITVKTYPVLSTKYQETVCTAGLRENGSWVRLYPIPFRLLPDEQQFKKFDWVECMVYARKRDLRPESFSPVNVHEIKTVGHIDTRQNWLKRRIQILDKARVYREFEPLIQEAKHNQTSLAIFKPKELLNFYTKPAEPWSTEKKRKTRELLKEHDLFDDNEWRKTYSLPEKIPYDFYYDFLDETGRRSNLKIHDWELGMLYLNCLRREHGDQDRALKKVKEKYWNKFRETDIHFFVGTTLVHQYRASNPFTIVGVFPIPYKATNELNFE